MYWAKSESFLESGELEGENMAAYKMPLMRSIDIDTEDDFILAEYYASKLIP
jgi:CMP-N-acetylneuraminic acid synthetase